MTTGTGRRSWRAFACAGLLAAVASGTVSCSSAGPSGVTLAQARACAQLTAAPAAAPPPVDPMRPAMGFDPFNTFGTTFDQRMIVAVVKSMEINGMRAAGYRYVILDDGWQGSRDSSGNLTADPGRFPCGIKRLAAFIHGQGFLLGLYTTPGSRSCADRTGSAGHVRADARTFASWGVDYVKLDWCQASYATAAAADLARSWHTALDATHRPMILSINAGGDPSVAPWAQTTTNSWRIGGDICGSWYNQSRPPLPTARRCYNDRRYHMGIVDYLRSPVLLAEERYAGPGHFLDPDMLEVGTAAESAAGENLPVYALTADEATTNFSMWAMWSAPLIAGNDPRTAYGNDAAGSILLNREVIAIDQDPLARPANLIVSGPVWQVWRKPLSGGRLALAVVNLGDRPGAAAFTWSQLRLGAPPAALRDVWAHRSGPAGTGLRVQLGAHGTAVYVLTPGR
jgi:alpha-galactosidase